MSTQSATPDPLLAAGGSSGPSFADVMRVLRKRRWLIVGIAISVPLISGFVVSKQPKIFEASASIVIEASVPQYLGQNFKDVVEMEASWWSAQEMLQTELRVIKSHSQAVAVAKDLCARHLPNDATAALERLMPGVNCSAASDYMRAAPLLQALVRVDPVRDSRVVNLVVDYNDPQLATLVANTAAQVYERRNLERRLSQSEGAATWLGDEYGDLSSQLNEAEHSLIEFKRKNNIVAVALEDQQNDLSTRRKKLADALSTSEVKLIGLRAQRDEYARLQSDDILNSIQPGVTDAPGVAKLKDLYIDQYNKVLELRGKYLEKHPLLLGAEARMAQIKTDLLHEAQLAQKTVEAQYNTILKEQREEHTALDAVTKDALQLEQRAIEYNRLKRNFDRLVKLSDQVGGRERETSLAGHLKTNNVRLMDAALVPTAAISPNVPRAVGIASLAGLIVALALAFALELLDSTIKTQEDIERIIGVPFLGVIPTIQLNETRGGVVAPPPALAEVAKAGSKELHILTHPKSAVAECCRSIRTNLLFMSPDRPAKALLISSAGPQEGKTTTAVSVAITLAQSGLRVLLVDTDMRRPRLHKVFGVANTSEGLCSAIVGEADVLKNVRETGIGNLFLLPCGALPPNPAELLHAERFKAIYKTLRESYDRIIYDSPPVAAVTDAAILARLVDGVVMVAKGGRTSKDALRRSRRELTGENVNILGCILNDLDLSDRNSYGYYYYYSHYGYYTSEDDDRSGGTGRRVKSSAG
jgi:succinoglycan biosynthesis transport protein ExoP